MMSAAAIADVTRRRRPAPFADSEWTRTEIGAWRWVIRADRRHLWNESELHWWESEDLGEAVKPGCQRSVRRLDIGGERMYCKRFQQVSVADSLRSLLRGSPARWEANRTWLAKRSGVPTAELLGYGERISHRGSPESLLVTRAITDTRTLADLRPPHVLPDTAIADDALLPEGLLHATAALIARLHASRLWHNDLHAGNVLWRHDSTQWSCWLIDLAGLRGGNIRPKIHHLMENLSRLWLSLGPLCPSTQRQEFAERYWERLKQYDAEMAARFGNSADDAGQRIVSAHASHVRRLCRQADASWKRGNRKVAAMQNGRGLAALGQDWLDQFARQAGEWWTNAETISSVSHPLQSVRLQRETPFGVRALRLVRFPKTASARTIASAKAIWESAHAWNRRGISVAIPWAYAECDEADFLVACEPQDTQSLTEALHSGLNRNHLQTGVRELVHALLQQGADITAIPPDAVRVSTDGRWLGWCAVELCPRAKWPMFRPGARTEQVTQQLLATATSAPEESGAHAERGNSTEHLATHHSNRRRMAAAA